MAFHDRIHDLRFTIHEIQAVDSHFASLNPPHHLSQVRISYLQRTTDQRSSWSWYWPVGYEYSSTSFI